MDGRLNAALNTVGTALAGLDAGGVANAVTMIAAARRVGLYGCGREGYQMRGFAMRLFHLGLDVGYLGEATMPPLGAGDCLIVSAGPGELATVTAQMKTAHEAGAGVLFLTAHPNAPSAQLADLVLAVPAQTMASDQRTETSGILPMGSVYEGALFFLFELLVADLKERLGETAETMRARHTNME